MSLKTMFSNGIYSKILLLTSRNKFMSTTDQAWIFFFTESYVTSKTRNKIGSVLFLNVYHCRYRMQASLKNTRLSDLQIIFLHPWLFQD